MHAMPSFYTESRCLLFIFMVLYAFHVYLFTQHRQKQIPLPCLGKHLGELENQTAQGFDFTSTPLIDSAVNVNNLLSSLN